MVGRRLGIALLVALPLMAVTTGPSGAGLIAGIPVNDPDFDTGKGDGTHDTQINPSSAFWGPKIGISGFDRYSDSPRRVGTAYTGDGGGSFIDNGNINGGSNLLDGRPSMAWNPLELEYVAAIENTFGPSGQRPAAVATSNSWGVNWSPFTDTDTSIGFGQVARFPSLAIDQNSTSSKYGHLGLTYVRGTVSLTIGDLYYQSSTPSATNFSAPVKVNNEASCPNVSYGELSIAGPDLWAAVACDNGATYTPATYRSTDFGMTWNAVGSGLPQNLDKSGVSDTCNSGSPVERTVYGDLGVFDFPRIVHDPMNNLMFLTTTDRGEGTDLSDVHVFGAVNSANPTWMQYPGLPGDDGATMVAPEAGVNYVKGTRNLWYSGAVIPQSGATYTFKTFVTTDLTNWTQHPFSPVYSLPVLQPNEDTAVPDCYYGHNLIDLDALGSKVGMTYVGTPDASRRPNGGVDYDPDILFASLDPPSDEPTDTSMTMTIKKTDAKIKASGKITPAVPGGSAEVTLLKKKDGVFQVVGSPKSAAFDDTGAYKASFNRPKRGTCKVVGDWDGDDAFGPSMVSKTFPCKK